MREAAEAGAPGSGLGRLGPAFGSLGTDYQLLRGR